MNGVAQSQDYPREPLEYAAVFPCLMERGGRTAHGAYPRAFTTSLVHVERDFLNGVFLSEAIVEGRHVRSNRLLLAHDSKIRHN